MADASLMSLRMLCHKSLIGRFIGKSGSTIKRLQLETGSKIRVEDSLRSGSEDRVIVIVARGAPFKKLKKPDDIDVDVDVEVSAVQEAALRVFEKVLEVSSPKETTSCRLLVEASRAGSVIGKGGKVVEKLRRESGAKIRVLVGDELPFGVSSSHEVVVIEGDVLAVKKALIGVSGCLQECPQVEKPSVKESRPLVSTSQPTVLNFHVGPPLQRMPLSVATTSSSPAVVGRPLSFDADRLATSDPKLQQREIVFRILCSNDRIGGVIGRGGSIVKALQDESRATISIAPSVSNCDERLVTITSKEDVESKYSPAQRAVVLVYSKSVEASVERRLESGSNKGSSTSARLVVQSNQVGCLLGKGGIIISEMRKATGAWIRIIRGEQMPKCVSMDDEVVEISGQFVNIQDALYEVTSRLRNFLFPCRVMNVLGSQTSTSALLDLSPHGRVGYPVPVGLQQYSGTSQSIGGQATIRQGLETIVHPLRLEDCPSIGLQTSEIAAGVNPRNLVNLGRGLASANGGLEPGSANRAPVLTNTTVEIQVPENAVSSVYGKNESNLTRIRQISGAKVVVREAHPGTQYRTVVISGTPDETQAARSLLHAFTLASSS